MESVQAHREPSEVTAEQGQVIIEGPNGVAITFVPAAAEETARRLLAAAAEARQQSAGPQAQNPLTSQ